MPVTAKLSSNFYQRLGDDAANELVGLLNTMDSTYLTELRQMNELNYARFEAKLEQRVAELRAEFKTGIAELRTEFKSGIADLRAEFDSRTTQLQAEGRAGFAGLRAEFTSGIADLRTEFTSGLAGLRSEHAKTRLELLKWTIGLLVPTFLAIVGVLIAVLRLR